MTPLQSIPPLFNRTLCFWWASFSKFVNLNVVHSALPTTMPIVGRRFGINLLLTNHSQCVCKIAKSDYLLHHVCHPSVRKEQLSSHLTDFHLIRYFSIFKKFHTKLVEKIKTHSLCSVTFFQKLSRLQDNAEKYGRAKQATDTCSEQVILIVFYSNNVYTNAPSCYVYTYNAHLVQNCHCLLCHGCGNPRCQAMQATGFFMIAPNICRSAVFNLLHVVLLPPEILRWFIHFLKIHEPLHQSMTIPCYTISLIGCPRRNVPDFGRVFLMLKYTDITQNTYVQS